MSFPHNLVLDSHNQKNLNLYNFLINWQILMKIVAKCSAFVSLPYQVHVKVCYPIPLKYKLQVPIRRTSAK